MRLFTLLAVLFLANQSFAAVEETKVVFEKPLPEADEETQVVERAFPNCKTLSGLYFCTAHGTRIRACFVELELKKEFVLAEFEAVGGGFYSSNECTAQSSIGRLLCRNGIESSHVNKMTCYSKKREE